MKKLQQTFTDLGKIGPRYSTWYPTQKPTPGLQEKPVENSQAFWERVYEEGIPKKRNGDPWRDLGTHFRLKNQPEYSTAVEISFSLGGSAASSKHRIAVSFPQGDAGESDAGDHEKVSACILQIWQVEEIVRV